MPATATKTADRTEKAEITTETPGVRLTRVDHPETGRPFDVQAAEVPGLGRIARWPSDARDQDGRPLFHYARFSGEKLGFPLRRPNGRPWGDEAADFELTLKLAASRCSLRAGLGLVDPAAAEFTRFKREYPEVAATMLAAGIPLEASRDEAPPELGGDVWLLNPPLRSTASALHDALRRFASDDWSAFGKAGEHEVGPLERWSLAIQPRAVKNAAARADRLGVVVGLYPCPARHTGAAGEITIAARWRGGTSPTTVWATWQPPGASCFGG